MNIQSTSKATRHIICCADKIRHASTKLLSPTKKAKHLGTEIWVYHHLLKNQVVYSLTKALNVRLTSNRLKSSSLSIDPSSPKKISSNTHHYRTTPHSAKSRSTASRPFRERSAKTTGTRWHESTSMTPPVPAPSDYPSSKSCASTASGTSTNGTTR